ncbi:MAG: MBL fold metallo-hydrolase [Rhodobacterales bacterium]|nr:MBL fold metallo-hydrolase [Rhodobacterales bacterium]
MVERADQVVPAMIRPRAVLAVLAAMLALGACALGDNPHYDPSKAHHKPNGFRNPPGAGPVSESHPLRFARFVTRRFLDDRQVVLPPDFVVAPADARAMLTSLETRNRVTWIGHATTLIGLDGVNILTDPIFTPYASPWPIKVERWVPPGLTVDDLPPLDAIVISHAHYDSLDLPSLRLIAARQPGVRVLVPLGLGPLVRGTGLANLREMDWYDRETLGAVTIQATPAIHNSQRSLIDKNFTLWSGFMLRGRDLAVWFSGDTAPGPLFDRVRDRAGRADVALVPIGAYQPAWLMKGKHTTPEEAAALARRLGASRAIGIHWGTFPLGEDPPLQTRDRFLATKKAGFTPQLLRIGETLALEKPPRPAR